MNTSDDSIISRLSLSQQDVKRLTVTQIKNIDHLLNSPPEALLNASRRLTHDDLISEMRLYHIPIHAAEYSFTQLVRFLRDLIPNWKISHEEFNILSAALGR